MKIVECVKLSKEKAHKMKKNQYKEAMQKFNSMSTEQRRTKENQNHFSIPETPDSRKVIPKIPSKDNTENNFKRK